MALKSPTYSISSHNNKIYEYELKKVKNSWLNLLTISINYNDQTFAKSTTQATYVYPKYYFGVTIPIGLIFLQPTNVKVAREAVEVGKDKQAELAREIKAEVLGKYKQYRLYEDLLRMQTTLINDVLANASQAEENFKKGAITVEAYILTQRSSSEELAKNMNLRLQQDLIKLEIEKMIGVPLNQCCVIISKISDH